MRVEVSGPGSGSGFGSGRGQQEWLTAGLGRNRDYYAARIVTGYMIGYKIVADHSDSIQLVIAPRDAGT